MSMRTHEQCGRGKVAIVTAIALLAQPVTPLIAHSASEDGQAATQTPAATASSAATQPVSDIGWPRAYQSDAGARFTIYQPQVSEWVNQKHMTAYAAVSVERPGEQKPALGTVKVEADTKVAVDVRMVSFSDLSVTESNFPTLRKEEVRDIVNEIVASIPTDDRVIALDRVLAHIDKSQITPKNVEGVKAEPPVIFFSKTPAVLVSTRGRAATAARRSPTVRTAALA